MAVAVALFPPKQETLLCEAEEERAAAGCVIVNVFVVVQPLESVTVTEQFPAAKLLAVEVVCPLLHA